MYYRLYDVTKTAEKESQSIYPGADSSYASLTEVQAEFETRIGNAMKGNDLAHFLLILDNIGNVIDSGFVGDTEISPRLIDVKDAIVGGVYTNKANMAKYDTNLDVSANYHTKKGSAMKDANCNAIMLYGFDGHGNKLEYDYWVRPITPSV